MQKHNEKQRRAELGEFLRTRRARLSSEQIGMPAGGRRRTPGLRREEVAIAAGVSTTWYTYLEQGRDIQVSSSILSSLARVLQLSDDERVHLFALANQPQPVKNSPLEDSAQRVYQQVLDELGTIPALLTSRTYDILAWNAAATSVFGDPGQLPAHERNMLWLLFSRIPLSRQINVFTDREQYAQEVLEAFRGRINRYLDDPEVQAFIARLQQASPAFQASWAEHNVRATCSSKKSLQHSLVGCLNFESVTFQVVEHPDVRCHMYVAADAVTAGKLHRLLKKEGVTGIGA
jgi:transcriptional regulator with XRE-family HTH domain